MHYYVVLILYSDIGRHNAGQFNYHVLYTGKFWQEKLANLANSELFAKINFPRQYTETVYGICIDCTLFAKFFLANSFCLYSSSKFYPTKYFPCTVTILMYVHSVLK